MAACRVYLKTVLPTVFECLSTEDPKSKDELTAHITKAFASLRPRLVPNDIATMPGLRREIDRIFVDLAKKAEPDAAERRAAIQAMQNRVDSTWRDLVPQLYSIDDTAGPTNASSDNEGASATSALAPLIAAPAKPQVGMPTEEDIANWSHHPSLATVDDAVLRAALKGNHQKLVSFVLALETNAQLITEAEEKKKNSDPPAPRPASAGEAAKHKSRRAPP